MSKVMGKPGCGPARPTPFGIADWCYYTKKDGVYYTTAKAHKHNSDSHAVEGAGGFKSMGRDSGMEGGDMQNAIPRM